MSVRFRQGQPDYAPLRPVTHVGFQPTIDRIDTDTVCQLRAVGRAPRQSLQDCSLVSSSLTRSTRNTPGHASTAGRICASGPGLSPVNEYHAVAEWLGTGLQPQSCRSDPCLRVHFMPCWWNSRHTALRTQRRKSYRCNSCAGYQFRRVMGIADLPSSNLGACRCNSYHVDHFIAECAKMDSLRAHNPAKAGSLPASATKLGPSQAKAQPTPEVRRSHEALIGTLNCETSRLPQAAPLHAPIARAGVA